MGPPKMERRRQGGSFWECGNIAFCSAGGGYSLGFSTFQHFQRGCSPCKLVTKVILCMCVYYFVSVCLCVFVCCVCVCVCACVFLHVVAKVQWKFSRWPFQKTVAVELDKTQCSMTAFLLPCVIEPDEALDSYCRRRLRNA